MAELHQYTPDSFTAYRARISLGFGPDDYFSEHGEIVLNWPYKDCVLEGGQTKEQTFREEKFFHPILSAAEINCLFEPKIFTNWKRHNSHGTSDLKLLKSNDNLLIKGNNLVVLHSLRPRFAGKVKLIYIDVPFNTGKDIFHYNDNFTHSTWLTFMKNRLEIARELLAEDGSIFLHVDWHECHYLKVLCDEIFGRDNFINEIIWCYTGPSSPKMAQLNRKHDTILWYSKTPDDYIFNKDAIRVPYSDPHQSMRKTLTNDTWTKEDEARMRARGRIPDDWWDDIPVAARAKIDGVRRTGYSTEKPYKLLDRILLMASNEGDLVLDFFAGSGTTLYSAARLNRHFIGVEQLSGVYRMMEKRLEAVGNFVSCELMPNPEFAASETSDAEKVDENLRYLNYADLDQLNFVIDEDKAHNVAFYS